MSDRSLPQRFRLPLPKPINDVIPYQQQTLNLHPAGKPMPNRRGRKPLATMPLGSKKARSEPNQQRAFRQRKENYIRNLELRALDIIRHRTKSKL
ncbi:hypothetical protein GLOIN_2v1580086 [Rhizophagus irregularis DAOM 181602=DAOM 197198]|nr:hypothetical protein GLOIN_2v1580086 [Rhizophagus irregularis DAOM 181602=DAOM 197198]